MRTLRCHSCYRKRRMRYHYQYLQRSCCCHDHAQPRRQFGKLSIGAYSSQPTIETKFLRTRNRRVWTSVKQLCAIHQLSDRCTSHTMPTFSIYRSSRQLLPSRTTKFCMTRDPKFLHGPKIRLHFLYFCQHKTIVAVHYRV